jgi:hypothetical protein
MLDEQTGWQVLNMVHPYNCIVKLLIFSFAIRLRSQKPITSSYFVPRHRRRVGNHRTVSELWAYTTADTAVINTLLAARRYRFRCDTIIGPRISSAVNFSVELGAGCSD